MSERALIVTTINPPNDCLQQLAAGAEKNDIRFIIAGDTKSPADFELPTSLFLSIDEQKKRFPYFAELLPTRHYARKNIAYLQAIEEGHESILETDDDNFPLDAFWATSPTNIECEIISHDSKWVNVYRLFSDEFIWPRGFPLEFLQESKTIKSVKTETICAPIVQGLANENPDVDAIYRLTRKLPVHFKQRAPVAIDHYNWCPFNSQNTLFRKEVFPLLYLPAYCSFRMTDIWRSFVAQRCLWEMNERLIFVAHTVYQQRNEHDLLRDFADEVPGYLNNLNIGNTLNELKLDADDLSRSLVLCYEAIVDKGWIGQDEILLVKRWAESFR